MDVFDRAQQLELSERERCIAEQRSRGAAAGASLNACEECGDAIAKERRAAVPGVRTCVVCARKRELMTKLFKRT